MAEEHDADLGIAGLLGAVEVGSGGFATVYRARQVAFDRLVAVKVFHDVSVDAATLATFQRECQAVGRVGGRKNILVVYDQGLTTSGRPYMTMPFLAGGSLQDVLNRRGQLPWAEAVDLGVKLAGALQIAHQASVLHRDVKPANVLLDDDGEPQLADFGIARLTDATRLTTGQASFTPAHVAPEVLTGSPPTPLVDVYALGSTIYELVAGHPAFVETSDDSFYAVMRRVESAPVPNLRPLGVPDAVCRVIESAMAKDPAQRPPSAGALATALNEARAPWHADTRVLPDHQRPQPPAPPASWGTDHQRPQPPAPPPAAWGTDEVDPPPPRPVPPPPPPPPVGVGAGRHRGALYGAMAAAAVILAAVVVAVLALHGSPGASTTTGTSTTTAPPGTATATMAQSEAQSLNSLLTESSSDRSSIVTATGNVQRCVDLSQAEQTLQMAGLSRMMLLTQLGQLNLSQLPGASDLVSNLTAAWQASMKADDSYAAWAADLLASGCGGQGGADANLQAAQAADAQASTAKTAFVDVWNPIATTYGLPHYTEAQI